MNAVIDSDSYARDLIESFERNAAEAYALTLQGPVSRRKQISMRSACSAATARPMWSKMRSNGRSRTSSTS